MAHRLMKRLTGSAGRLIPGGLGLLAGVVLFLVSGSIGVSAIGGPSHVYLPMIVTGAGSGPSSTPTGGPTATPTLAPTATPTSTPTPVVLGGTSRLGIWTGSGSATTAADVQNAGGQWTRLPISWATIEPLPSPAPYDFSSYDSQIAAFAAAGVNPIVEIRDNPAWAASTACGPIDLPGGMTAFGSFVQATVQRYDQAPYNVHTWELYNEPDGTSVLAAQQYGVNCFGQNSTTEAGYVALLQTAYTTIKASDPTATVYMGGLAYENLDIFNYNFLDQILQLSPSAAPYFDVANLHYFSSQTPNWSAYGPDIAGKVNKLRAVMAAHGVTKPVAVTETSWTTSGPTDPDIQTRQANYVAKVFARGLNLNLYAIIWFSLADWTGSYPYGLLDANMVPRPAYGAFKAAAAEFGQASSVQPLAPAAIGATGGVEGYSFVVGGHVHWVLWASPDGSSTQILIPAGWSQVKDVQGNAIPLAGLGLSTTYQLTDSPIFVEF